MKGKTEGKSELISQLEAVDDSIDPGELELQPLHVSKVLGVDTDDDYDDYEVDSYNGSSDLAKQQLQQETEEVTLYPLEGSGPASSWKQAVEDWLFPPQYPRSCQLLRPENIAIPACYLLVGLLQGLSSPLINVLPLDLNATEAQQTTLSSIRGLPSSFKLIFGFMSDTLPIAGYRRKPYMIMGWCLASFSMFSLLMGSNLKIPFGNAGCYKHTTNSTTTEEQNVELLVLPDDVPSVPFLSMCLLGFGIGFWLADVMGDSVVAEKAKLEPAHSRGAVQSTCYAYRFFGMMCAAPLSTFLYSTVGPYYVVLLLAALPLTILPAVFYFYEVKHDTVRSTGEQCHEIWNTVCSRAVWQPMGFVFLYNVLQVGNAAWRQFLVTVLHFTTCQLNMILITAFVLLYLGIMAYKYYLISWSWRNVYILTTLLNGFFSLLQVLLIKGITFGLPAFWFALGDDAFAEFIGGIQFLPTTIMMVHLCPTGSEGASYAMFTTVNNSALTLSSAISTMLLGIWDVSKKALEQGYLQGMINLTLLTTACQVGAIVFVGLLPHYKEGLQELKASSYTSATGGFIFLTITFCSICYAIGVGILNVIAPGWMGESR